MTYSKYNIFSKIKDSENSFIINLLSGNADIIFPKEAQILQNLIDGKEIPSDYLENLITKGYVVDEKGEDLLYRSKYRDTIFFWGLSKKFV